MRKISLVVASILTVALSASAMAQIKNNNIPAGTSSAILSGTPSGASPGAGLRSPPVAASPGPLRSGKSSACPAGDASCGSIIVPVRRPRGLR